MIRFSKSRKMDSKPVTAMEAKRKPGRPAKTVKNGRLTVMLPVVLIQQIKVLADQRHQTYSAVIQELVEAGMADI